MSERLESGKVASQETAKEDAPLMAAGPIPAKENRVVCPEMCFYCFDVLISHLGTRNGTFRPVVFPDDFANDE